MINKLLLLFFAVSLLGCSTAGKWEVIGKKIVKEVKKNEIEAGPSLKEKKARTFFDKTKEYGLENIKATHLYSVDLNNDLYSDLVVLPSFYSVPEFFFFDSKKKKFLKREDSPFEEVIRASYLNFFDLNKDGILDVLVGSLNQKTELTRYPPRIFLGEIEKGRIYFYKEVGGLQEELLPTSAGIAIDLNLDGNLELFFANWFDFSKEKPKPQPDKILSWDGKRFKNTSYLLKGEFKYNSDLSSYTNARATFGASTCDIDQNGFPDILTASSSGMPNKLWLNLYDEKFKDRVLIDYGVESGFAKDREGRFDPLGAGNTVFSKCSDYNNDGIMDVVVGEITHAYDSDRRDRSSILTGSRFKFPPYFYRTEYQLQEERENWDQGDRQGNWVDLNFDGLTDLIVDNSGFPPHSRLVYFTQNSDHSFEDIAKAERIDILNPSGTIVVDLNRDGKMDIITGQSDIRLSGLKTRIYVFENQIKRKGKRSIRFFLRGKKANLHGLGAMVILKTNKSTMRQYVEYNSGSQPSQNEEGIYFGLGKQRLNQVQVEWPFSNSKDVAKRGPLLKNYSLKNLKFKNHLDLTLCESGKFKIGRKSSCR